MLRTGWESRWGDPKRFRGEKVGDPVVSTPTTVDSTPSSDGTVDTQFYDPSESGIGGQLSFPGFGESAAKFLAVERAVRGVGVDVISIDPGNQNVVSWELVIFLKMVI